VKPRKKPDPPAAGELRVRLPEGNDCLRVPADLPLVPLRDTVIFPGMTLPLFIGRPASVAALDAALAADRLLVAVAQRSPATVAPERGDLYQVGTLVRVIQIFRLPDGTRRVLAEGLATVRVVDIQPAQGHPMARVEPFPDPAAGTEERAVDRDLVREVRDLFRRTIDRDERAPAEARLAIRSATRPADLAHRVSSQLRVPVSVRQRLLECGEASRQLALLRRILAGELRRPATRTNDGAPGKPADAPAAPQGHGPGAADELAGATAGLEETAELAAAIEAAGMPPPVAERARRELGRLAHMSLLSPEATVVRTYLEWLIHTPWVATSEDCTDLARARRVLDEDHHGLAKVKERILEQIAVIKLSREIRGPLLCLVGPPGVGKTSLARSIARSLGRRFVRVSLGGIRDEAEIRGHRRTYVGSMPGRILQGMRRAGTVNPVFLLDELDKLAHDQRGDPAAALLEVLDPEQNAAFSDHYLEVDYDLSKTLFIATANVLDAIPEPLRDRLEVIRIPGYLEDEKLKIAGSFLAPRQVKANGLRAGDLILPAETQLAIIRGYTREAGVRGLEREIARLCRRVAMIKAGGAEPPPATLTAPRRGRKPLGLRIEPAHLASLLGVPRHAETTPDTSRRVGIATGLAWTEAGGEVLTVECAVVPGRGRLLLTGKLGETMRESAQAALSYIRSRAHVLDIDPGFYRRCDIHIHLPEGAIPKDGPSAGVTIALALASALTDVPTRADLAMTGEITLRGRVLPVGGVAEKVVAARRAGVTGLILPKANEPHIMELPEELRGGLAMHFVESMDQVLLIGLCEARMTAPVGEADDGGTYLTAA
jgi:ATP-dependent Lon protease